MLDIRCRPPRFAARFRKQKGPAASQLAAGPFSETSAAHEALTRLNGESPRKERIPERMDARLVPSLIVILLAWVGGTMPKDHPDPCASTDAPQFKCWLDEHG